MHVMEIYFMYTSPLLTIYQLEEAGNTEVPFEYQYRHQGKFENCYRYQIPLFIAELLHLLLLLFFNLSFWQHNNTMLVNTIAASI